MRQLFTNSPFMRIAHEPHSPSPQPSLVPVNPNVCRRTSSNLSIGKTRTSTVLPFTVNERLHWPQCSEELVIALLVTALHQGREFLILRRRYSLASAERNRS